MSRLHWPAIVERAALIVSGYDESARIYHAGLCLAATLHWGTSFYRKTPIEKYTVWRPDPNREAGVILAMQRAKGGEERERIVVFRAQSP